MTSGSTDSFNGGGSSPGLAEQTIVAALDRLLACPSFKASDRLRSFLSYVVSEALAGRADRIKAYTIATDVFHRGADFDPNSDPIVRIEAGRLRRALENYYLKDGANDPLIIDIPKGSYAPVFSASRRNDTPLPDNRAGPTLDASVTLQTFRVLSSGADDGYLGAGIAEEIGVTLAQYPEVRIVPSSEGSADMSARQLGEALGVQFVVSGSVQRDADTIHVTARLVEASSGTQIWAQSFDRDLSTAGLLEVQNDIAKLVVVNIADSYGGAIGESLRKRIRSVPTEDYNVYEAILRLHHYNRVGAMDAWSRTRAALERAIESDANYAPALAGLAELTADGFAYAYLPYSRSDAERALELARKAARLEPTDCQPHFSAALVYNAMRDVSGVTAEAGKILSMDASVTFRMLAGWLLVVAGDYERGVPLVSEGIRLLPVYPPWIHHALFLERFRAERFEDALAEARQFDMPTLIWSFLDRAIAFAALDQREDARAEIDKVTAMHPDFVENPGRYIEWYVLDDTLAGAMAETLRAADLI